MTTYTAVLTQAPLTAELANSARKLPRPVNWVGGLSGDTRKNASTVVSTVGTNDSAPMNTTKRREQDVRQRAAEHPAAPGRTGRNQRQASLLHRMLVRVVLHR